MRAKFHLYGFVHIDPVLVWVGADVTHPGPGVANRPSVASLVFSWDREASRYVATSRVQSPRQEMIGDLKDMMMVRECPLGHIITQHTYANNLVAAMSQAIF